MAPALLALLVSAQNQPLWSIGTSDGKAGEFALAPGGYDRYAEDPVFVVGESKAADWPYVAPGPDDAWAQSRPHKGEIVFGLAGRGSARLTLAFAETHPSAPPRISIRLNGRVLNSATLPKGKGDDTVLGRAESGRPFTWTIDVPAIAMREGNNRLEIATDAGSWAVYDAIRFEGSPGMRDVPVRPELSVEVARSPQAILKTPAGDRQPVRCLVTNIGPAAEGTLTLGDFRSAVRLKPGRQSVEMRVPPVKRTETIPIAVSAGGLRKEAKARLERVRPWTVYLFPHSHVDIGYTDRQERVLAMHERNLTDAIAVAEASKDNPPDSRFRFNVEAIWVLDRYLKTATPAQVEALRRALKDGSLAVSAGYANLLTGMMRPEEQIQSYRYGRLVAEKLGVSLDTVSQTDVPGITWGETVALHEAGIRNLVLMPNAGDRTGGVHRAWRDRPFWWVGPSGRERILVWQTDPYSVGVSAGWDGDRSHPIRTADPSSRFLDRFLFQKLDDLAQNGYPYDILGEPWSVTDNAPVDADVPAAAKAWNERYAVPRVVISTLSDACREMTRRYGGKLPTVRGDYTPYWEDGNGSAAAETAASRAAADRLVQAETLFALRGRGEYPVEAFREAWRNVILFSEHTWGAAQSVWSPDDPEVAEQWRVKRQFATDAEAQADALLKPWRATRIEPSDRWTVRNTSSWKRTDLVTLAPDRSRAGDRVEDERGRPIPSQRLRSGGLAVLVRDLPAFGARTIRIRPGTAFVEGTATAEGATLRNDRYEVRLDPATGAVASALDRRTGKPLAKAGLNGYLYLLGDDPKRVQTNGRPRIEVVESGPLVATLRATSDAPGTNGLMQEVSLVAGLDRVDFTNTLDKRAVREKEAVHFAFPLDVPEGQMRVEIPWTSIRPERDQIAGANKNWLTTEGYVDVSNRGYGVTCESLDAPLLEVGEISATLLGSKWNPDEWRQRIGPTQTWYSWALNNHWHTNYRADQSGRLVFRYALIAHGAFAPDAAARFSLERRQPLVVDRPGEGGGLVEVGDPTVLVTRAVPTDDGRAILVRLWGTSNRTRHVRLRFREGLGPVTRIDLSQASGAPIGETVEVPGHGILTLRVERSAGVPAR